MNAQLQKREPSKDRTATQLWKERYNRADRTFRHVESVRRASGGLKVSEIPVRIRNWTAKICTGATCLAVRCGRPWERRAA